MQKVFAAELLPRLRGMQMVKASGVAVNILCNIFVCNTIFFHLMENSASAAVGPLKAKKFE